MSSKIPSLTDKEWSQTNELGTKTEIIEYPAPDGVDGMKQVEVTLHLISGEEGDAINAQCSEIVGGEAIIDEDLFSDLRMCAVFGMNLDTWEDIKKNKPESVKNQMILLSAELMGANNLSEEEVEEEKNSEG